jgi:hypothetical protein
LTFPSLDAGGNAEKLGAKEASCNASQSESELYFLGSQTGIEAPPIAHINYISASVNGSHAAPRVASPRTPTYAVLLGGFVSVIFNIIIYFTVGDDVTAADDLLRISVWVSCLCYALQMISYIKIRYSMPTLPRPAKSPLGIPGAIMTLMLASIFGIIAPFSLPSEAYKKSLVLILVFLLAFYLYYNMYVRRRLVKSPEKLFLQYVLKQTSFDLERIHLRRQYIYKYAVICFSLH